MHESDGIHQDPSRDVGRVSRAEDRGFCQAHVFEVC